MLPVFKHFKLKRVLQGQLDVGFPSYHFPRTLPSAKGKHVIFVEDPCMPPEGFSDNTRGKSPNSRCPAREKGARIFESRGIPLVDAI